MHNWNHVRPLLCRNTLQYCIPSHGTLIHGKYLPAVHMEVCPPIPTPSSFGWWKSGSRCMDCYIRDGLEATAYYLVHDQY